MVWGAVIITRIVCRLPFVFYYQLESEIKTIRLSVSYAKVVALLLRELLLFYVHCSGSKILQRSGVLQIFIYFLQCILNFLFVKLSCAFKTPFSFLFSSIQSMTLTHHFTSVAFYAQKHFTWHSHMLISLKVCNYTTAV